MKSKRITGFIASMALASLASAGSFTTVNVADYVNSSVQFNPATFPTGSTDGNQGAGIPFEISLYNGSVGNWSATPGQQNNPAVDVLDVKVNAPGNETFYALLNNGFGTPGLNEYDLTFKATNGASVTFQSIGGVDTRDYNQNYFTNTISGSTVPWFNNDLGQRIDMREFTLPASFAGDTISDFVITQTSPGDNALFWGLTYGTGPATATPEPISVLLSGIGLLTIGVVGVKRRARSGRSAQ